ncbi:glycoside hydrolase, partial [Rhizoclosmatium globosum]
YNIINIGFWLDAGAWDSMVSWTGYDAATRQSYVDAYHKAGKLVLVSAFGAAEWPTLSGQDPIKSAQNLAAFVKQYQLDGADIDWEDNNSVQAGTGEAWLIKFTTELRNQLPRPYVISHAPQAPYFINNKAIYPNGAYLAVDKAVGSLIDYYNIQFYNQGSNTRYDTCQTLLNQSGGDWPGTSLFEIAASGVPLNKLVIGKPITAAGAANTGYTDPATLASCVAQAKAKGWDAGVFGWQY